MEMKRLDLSLDNAEIAFAHKSNGELKRANFLFSLMSSNMLVKLGTSLIPFAFKIKLPVKWMVKSTIFRQFCGGETLNDCAVTIGKLSDSHVDSILDYGVEGKQTDEDFDRATEEFLKAIQFAKANRHIPFISLKVTGLAKFLLLEKVNRQEQLSEGEIVGWNRVKGRIHRIAKAAHDANISLMIDAEESWIQLPVDMLAEEMSKFYNKERATVFNTIQLYRHDRLAFLKESFQKAKSDNYILGVKLVRGAYMEKERERAAIMKYTSPIQVSKEASDRDYNFAIDFCMENISDISFCVASHNEYSNLYATKLIEQKGLPHNHPHLCFSQLYGMGDHITFNLANAGYNVSKYVPYGPVKDVIPYLMRRAQENTSVSGQTGRELSLVRKELKRRKTQDARQKTPDKL